VRVGVFVPAEGPEDHQTYLRAFAQGVDAQGDFVMVHDLSEGYQDCDVAVIFGVPKFEVPSSQARGEVLYEHRFRRKRPVIIMERGFIHREKYYNVAVNGLNGLGDFGAYNRPPDRWDALNIPIRPWVDNPTGHFLVCGQVPWDASVQHTDHIKWCQKAVQRIVEAGYPVVFRPHPQVHGSVDYKIPFGPGPTDPLPTWDQDLAGARAVVTYSSTSSALAVLLGFPIFALDRGSIAWAVANHELSTELLAKPRRMSREQWAYNLAYSQWTEREMMTGQPWLQLKGCLNREEPPGHVRNWAMKPGNAL